jgi:hypothetical protein
MLRDTPGEQDWIQPKRELLVETQERYVLAGVSFLDGAGTDMPGPFASHPRDLHFSCVPVPDTVKGRQCQLAGDGKHRSELLTAGSIQ